MNYKLRKGTRVKIIKDVRPGEPATGMKGIFVGHEGHEAWLLCTANGKLERESYELPDGYVEWDPEKEVFPEVSCGIRDQSPRFLLEDGTYIHGLQCYWMPTNLNVMKKISESYQWLLRKLGTPEDQIPTLEQMVN